MVAARMTAGCTTDLQSLMAAIEKGDRVRVEALIAADPSLARSGVLVRRGTGVANRPLHAAADKGNLEIVALLLEKGADANATIVQEVTALHIAARSGNEAIVSLLLKRGAKVDARTLSGETPLHDAASHDKGATIQALISAGADVNARNQKRETPLHLAAAGGDVGLATELCASGRT